MFVWGGSVREGERERRSRHGQGCRVIISCRISTLRVYGSFFLRVKIPYKFLFSLSLTCTKYTVFSSRLRFGFRIMTIITDSFRSFHLSPPLLQCHCSFRPEQSSLTSTSSSALLLVAAIQVVASAHRRLVLEHCAQVPLLPAPLLSTEGDH